MKNLILLLLLILTFDYSQGQLLTLTNGKRTKAIDCGKEITLNGKEITTTSDTIDFNFTGYVISASSDSIVIRPTESKLVVNTLDKRNYDITTGYRIDPVTKTSISISTLKNIKTRKKTIDAVCAIVWTLGFLTATIVSPIISIDFKNGTFDKSKYATITGLSIASIAVSATFDLSFSKRKFNFIKRNNPWKIIKYDPWEVITK